MCNANGLKESVEFMVFPSPLSLNTFNFGIQLVFHRGLKIKKPNHNIIFTLKKKNPSKMTETAYINEWTIIMITLIETNGEGYHTSE